MTAPDARQPYDLRDGLATALRSIAQVGLNPVDVADALLPVFTAWAAQQARARAVEELTMAADAAEHCVENPEMPWAQGVEFVVEALRDRADALESGGSR